MLIICVLQSCKRDDDYYSLSDETRGFFVFEAGETFKLKNEETGEIINFKVTEKEFSFGKEYYESSMVSFGAYGGETYVEYGMLRFIDDSGCYTGGIVANTDSKNINTIDISLQGCFSEQYYQPYKYYGKVDVLGKEYQDAYLFSSNNDMYYSKEKGILKIVDYQGVLKFSIVE